jgi:hypothetical protein
MPCSVILCMSNFEPPPKLLELIEDHTTENRCYEEEQSQTASMNFTHR